MNFRFVGIISGVMLSHITGVFIVVIDVVVNVSMRVCVMPALTTTAVVSVAFVSVTVVIVAVRGHCCRCSCGTRCGWRCVAVCRRSVIYCACARQRSQTQAPTAWSWRSQTTQSYDKTTSHHATPYITLTHYALAYAQEYRIRGIFGAGRKEQGDGRGLIYRTIEWQQQNSSRWANDTKTDWLLTGHPTDSLDWQHIIVLWVCMGTPHNNTQCVADTTMSHAWWT